MAFQRNLPHIDPEAKKGRLLHFVLRMMSKNVAVALEGSLPSRLSWRLMPILMRLTGGRLAWLVPLPIGVIETRDARNGKPHRRVVLYFHDGDRVVVIPSKAGLPEDPFWYHNALADPAVRFETKPYRAEPVDDPASEERLWAMADRFYPPSVTYRTRAARSGRRIPLLRLIAL